MSKHKNYDLQIPGQAVVQTAKAMKKKNGEVTLSTGVRARIQTVAAPLIDSVTSKIPKPVIPKEPNPDKENRLEDNPQSPSYIAALKDYTRARGEAVMSALVMFGLELLDPIPEDNKWIMKLKFLEKQEELDLSKYDIEDPIDREYLYKAFIAVGYEDYKLIMESASIPTEAMERAAESFRRENKRGSDSGSVPEGQAEVKPDV